MSAVEWDISVIDKAAFFRRAHDLYGEALVKCMRAAMEEAHTSHTEHELAGNGTFCDEEDLAEKYKNKPKRLEAIMKNTRKMWDSVGECYLYEDMSYVSSTSHKVAKTTTQKRTCHTEEKVKRAVAKRGPKEPKETSQPGDPLVAKPLTEKQSKSVKKLISDITKGETALRKMYNDTFEKVDGEVTDRPCSWVQFMPEHVLKGAKADLIKAAGELQLLQEVSTAEASSDFKGIQDSGHRLKESMKEVARKMKVQIGEAQRQGDDAED